jgi:hypothetical protein
MYNKKVIYAALLSLFVFGVGITITNGENNEVQKSCYIIDASDLGDFDELKTPACDLIDIDSVNLYIKYYCVNDVLKIESKDICYEQIEICSISNKSIWNKMNKMIEPHSLVDDFVVVGWSLLYGSAMFFSITVFILVICGICGIAVMMVERFGF